MRPSNKKRTPLRKPRSKAPLVFQRTAVEDIAPEEQIIGAPLLGKIIAYDHDLLEIQLAIEEPLSVGDAIRVKGRTTDLTQRVERLHVGRRSVQSALAGETVLLRIADTVAVGDAVYKVRSS